MAKKSARKKKSKKAPDTAAVSVTALLHRALRKASDLHARAAGTEGLTQRQHALLAAIHAHPGANQSALVKASGIDRSTLAELAARLRGRGLIEARRSDADARANLVRLTEAGERALVAGEAPAAEADARLLAPLGPKKRAALIELLGLLAADRT